MSVRHFCVDGVAFASLMKAVQLGEFVYLQFPLADVKSLLKLRA